MHRSFRFALVILLALPFVVAGCATARQGALTPLQEGQLGARAALEVPDAEADPLEHARALAQAEWKLGRPYRASQAIEVYLRRAESAWWVSRLYGDEEAVEQARRELGRAGKEAIRWAKRGDNPELMVRGIMAHPRPRRYQGALRHAVAQLDSIPRPIDLPRLLELVGDDAAARREIARWVSGEPETLQALGLQALPPDPVLLPMLAGALQRQVYAQAPAAELRRSIAAVQKADPWHLGAAILSIGLEEREAGTIADDSLLLEDLYWSDRGFGFRYVDRPQMARLTLRLRAQPESRALRLALAWLMVRGHMVGDAMAELVQLDAVTEPEIAEVRDQLLMMSALHQGVINEFEGWLVGDRIDSPSVDEWLLNFTGPEYGEYEVVVAAARRRQAERSSGLEDRDLAWDTVFDEEVSEAARARARRRIGYDPAEQRAWEAVCRQRERTDHRCNVGGSWVSPGALTMAGRTRHFHPSLLPRAEDLTAAQLHALAPVLEHYVGSVVAASPDFQAALLRVRIVQGRYDEARTLLETQGDLLPEPERAWAWLVLDDLEQGVSTFDDANAWYLPVFDHQPSDSGSTRAEAPPVSRLDHYLQGMGAGRSGEHQRALELLMPVLDAVPDAAMTQGLAQAALSAHLAGDPRFEVLQQRLRDVDPHGPEFALLAARAARDAGQPEVERRFVTHALRWHPDDALLYDALLRTFTGEAVPSPELALAYIVEGEPAYDHRYLDLRQGIRTQKFQSLTAVQQALRGLHGGPEEGWALGPSMLAKLPLLVPVATDWSDERIEEAANAEEAVQWGDAAFELHQAVGIHTRWQLRDALWSALLGNHAVAGLALARQRDLERRFTPLSDGDSLVLLLEARRAGEIDDPLAWDLWRWGQGLGGAASQRVAALIAEPPEGSVLQVFACNEVAEVEEEEDPEDNPAYDLCAKAFAANPSSTSLVVNQLYLGLNHPDEAAGEARVRGALASGVTRASFMQEPTMAESGSLSQTWHQNYAVWLDGLEQHEAAAEHWWQAVAFGLEQDAGRYRGESQLRWRGSMVRALAVYVNREPRALQLQRSRLSLLEGRPTMARRYAEVARAMVVEEPGAFYREALIEADRRYHLARWAEADIRDSRITTEGLHEVAKLFESNDPTVAKRLHRQFPQSSLLALARIETFRELGEDDRALKVAENLLGEGSADPLIAAALIPLWVAAERVDEAKALYEAADAANPGDSLMLYVDAPESVTGMRRFVPSWVRDPERFDRRLSEVTDAQIAALAPVRRSSEERVAEIFVPGAWKESEKYSLRYRDGHGARVLVLTEPRDSRCQGEACVTDLIEDLGGSGRTQQWMRETTLAGLPAMQAMFTSPEEVLVAWVLPSGGRVFTVVMAASTEHFTRLRPVMVMLRDGFRPLDGVRSAFSTSSLRKAGPTLRDSWRLRGRREQARADDLAQCPVSDTLAAMAHDHQRAELLIDLWLGMPDADSRLALLHCTGPREAEARRLALVALLDEDPRAHEFGAQAVQTHASQVDADVRTLLSTPAEHPISAPDYLIANDTPPRGLVEVLGSLPLARARELGARLLASKDARDRRLAWAAVRLRPALASEEAIANAMGGDPELVVEAAALLAARARPGDAEPLRAYLDGASSPTNARSRRALRSVAMSLAAFIDEGDEARLSALPGRIEDGKNPERAKRFRESLQKIADDHGQALAELRGLKPEKKSDRVEEWLTVRETRGRSPRSEADLRDAGLAEVLPGDDWIFARLAAPGLFASTVADVAGRLTSEDEAVDQRLSELTSVGLRAGGFAALSETGGLNSSEPIECAKPAAARGWVCTAGVTDRKALLTVLGQREYGKDAGVSLPLTMATTAGVVPLVMTMLPAILHYVVYSDEDEEEDDDEDDEPGTFIASPYDDEDDGAVDTSHAEERARTQIRFGDMSLDVYSIVSATSSRIGIDSERYLFIGDRLWVFSTDTVMRRVMLQPSEPVLADAPEFKRLTRDWKDGAALQAVAVGDTWSMASGGASIEVVLDESGLHFRYSAALEKAHGVNDIGPALAQLPPGALTTFGHGVGRFSEADIDVEPLTAEGADSVRVPPLPLLSEARGVAFGWYLEDGDRLWRRWLAVAPLDAPLRKALREGKTPPGRKEARRHGGLCYRERADFLFVGDCELVEQAANEPPPPSGPREQLRVGYGSFDGAAIAERLPGLAGLPVEEKIIFRGVAPLFNIFTALEVEADWTPATGVAVVEGHVGVRLRPAGDHSRVIDDWLATKEARNAASLPRRVRFEELEGDLRYTVEVPDAEAFARDTLADSPRTKVEVLGPTRVRLTVEPVATSPRPAPLEKSERKRLTKRTDEFSTEDPRIVELARSIVPEGTAPVQAAELVSQWVHERISYEVTPRILNGVEILEAGRGDCTEYATLTVTLLRALDVPAEIRSGMAAAGDEMVAHAWVGFHDGVTWHEIDPTWGRKTATSGHLEMSVLDALALVSLGKLEVVEIAAP